MEDRPAKEGEKMKEQSPHSLLEKGFRIGGAGLLAITSTIAEAKNTQAAPVDVPPKNPLVEPTKTKTAGEALSEMGVQLPALKVFDSEIAQTRGGDAFRGKDAQSEIRVEATQTITETFANLLVTRECNFLVVHIQLTKF